MNMQRAIFSAGSAAVILLASATGMATVAPDPPPSACTIIKRSVLGNINDAFIWSAQPNYKAGGESQLGTGLSSGGGEKRALLRADLASIPAGALVTSATFYVNVSSNWTQTVRAHQVLTPWIESTVTWNNFGAIDPVTVSSFVSGYGWKAIPVTGLAQAWVDGTQPNHGILLEEDLVGNTFYKSSEYGVTSNLPGGKPADFPYLEICYTQPMGSIGDTVWFDSNADGFQDPSEPGISGVVLDLSPDGDCDGVADASPIATVATGLGGTYHFSDLLAGCYVVTVDENTLPPGHVSTTGGSAAVSLASGETNNDVDFGYVTYSSIGDTVWLDSDGNGSYDPLAGELGVNDILVELYHGGALVDFTYTGISPYTNEPGFYLFDSLPPGNYTVVISPDNFADGGPLAGLEQTADLDGVLDSVTTVSLGAGEDILDADFGYQMSCGNGVCQGDEGCSTCAVDCGSCPPVCGNGTCEPGEDCSSCSSDCDVCPPTCGNGACEAGEGCATCAGDCGACPPECGNGTCEAGEGCSTCAEDCGDCPAVCGDGTCEAGEDCSTCAGDCGACPEVCGNEVCEAGESCTTCPNDCGLCPVECGNGMCQAGQTCSTCAEDCGACPPVCGDGTCGANEDCASCSADCGACPVAAPGTGTVGYWKNHPDAWPVDSLVIGGKTYTKAQLLTILNQPPKGDVTYQLAHQLIAAKLNVGVGNQWSCIESTIANADAWLAQHPIGSNVKAGGNNSPWVVGQPLQTTLDGYNNGLLCAPHRG